MPLTSDETYSLFGHKLFTDSCAHTEKPYGLITILKCTFSFPLV